MRVTGSDRRILRIPRGWRLRPARTLRLRLTLLYGGCFLVAGAALLAITYGLVSGSDTVKEQQRFVLNAGNKAKLGLVLPPSDRLYISKRSGSSGGSSGTVQASPQSVHSAGGSGAYPSSGPTLLGGPSNTHVRNPPGSAAPPPYALMVHLIQRLGRRQISALVGRAQVAIASQHNQTLGALLTESGVALAIMALVSVLLGWLLAGRALRPLRAMNLRARQITEDTLHEGLAVDTRQDELGELAAAFDGLLGRLERAFGAQRRFVANASHELRTPVTLQRALVEVTLADPEASNEELRQTCERVLAAGEQQERVIEALLALARGQAGVEDRKPVDLAVLAADLLDAREAQTAGLELDVELRPAIVAGDEALLERSVANLLDNAIVHNLADGWISLQTASRDGRAVLRIANAGAAIPPERVEELFEPFRRLGDERTAGSDGLGLGLSIVQAITLAHGGSIRALPGDRGGLELVVEFDVAEASASAHISRAAAENLAQVQG